jgi:hypothetical protein
VTSDEEYAAKRKPDCIYVSRAFSDFDGGPNKRILHLVLEPKTHNEFAVVVGEAVIRETPGAREQIKAIIYEDTHEIDTLVLQRFGMTNGKPYKASFALRGDEIAKLLQVVRFAASARFSGKGRLRIDDAALQDLSLSADAVRGIAREHLEIATEVVQNNITKRDLRAIAYRRQALNEFGKLLNDGDFFRSQKSGGNSSDESVWQAFFERNTWIFGYGLLYTSLQAFRDKPLERTVAGYSIRAHGKRVDALLKTRGEISAICFVEIKTDKTELLAGTPYRPDSWSVSRELAGAVAQSQRTAESAAREVGARHEETDAAGNPTGESAYLYQPRSVVVAGSLSQFDTDKGVNEAKLSSFELFRRQLQNPEIITFDELFARATFIVEGDEGENAPDPWNASPE